jgi:hypothetical protein
MPSPSLPPPSSKPGASPKPPPWIRTINIRTLTAPLAAFTMACLLFVYTRSSITAAKRNARLTREADGGQISWKNESRRRHGLETKATAGAVVGKGKAEAEAERAKEKDREVENEEEKIKARRWKS